ncbi:hypothetical protein J1N35_036107 [Gossypium stocksii]|uniref:RNase H type-1 domain-containing protein n=1 Tax=Gossypium stocksii TaxID=47602 RepID=A0A9D3UHF8_9ROSI|nr:hypothetical protein J1N35_036107 [Gossypium stocksii]
MISYILAFETKVFGELWWEAEFWGVVEGLQIAWRNGHKRIILEIDGMPSSNAKFGEHRLCEKTRKQMNKEWEVIIQHTYGEGNKLTDGLPSLAWDKLLQYFVFYSPPDAIRNLLDANANGVVTPRLVVVFSS